MRVEFTLKKFAQSISESHGKSPRKTATKTSPDQQPTPPQLHVKHQPHQQFHSNSPSREATQRKKKEQRFFVSCTTQGRKRHRRTRTNHIERLALVRAAGRESPRLRHPGYFATPLSTGAESTEIDEDTVTAIDG